MAKDPIYYKLLEACKQPGCPACRVIIGIVDRFLDGFFYESVNDIPLRSELRKSYGFCKTHAWRLLDGEAGNALGIAIIYHDVLTNVLRALPGNGQPGKPPSPASLLSRFSRQAGDIVKNAIQAITPKQPCPACIEREQVTRLTIAILVNSLQEEQLVEALDHSEGLCLPHIRQALEQNKDEKSLDFLLGTTRERLYALQVDLAEFIRKNDYRYQHEGFGMESNSWRKATSTTIGERDS